MNGKSASGKVDATHIMIDIETLGTKPGSVILSIGAVVFSPEDGRGLGDEFYVGICPESSQGIGLTIQAGTVGWWMQQSDEARIAAFNGDKHVRDALAALREWVSRASAAGAVRIWAHPPSFDIVLLEAAFKKAGIAFLPWGFRDVRDTRTLFDLAGVDPRAFKGDETAHNALDDARTQARAAIQAYGILGIGEAA